jgi:hypothetical protein
MSEDSYLRRYAKWWKERIKAKGYDFHQDAPGNIPPPKVAPGGALRWWSLDRWKRLKKVRDERDRRLQDILNLKHPPKT